MDGVAEEAQRSGPGREGALVPRPAAWRGTAVLAALMLAALTFNTAENLPVGLLEPISRNLGVSVSAVGLLVTGYGATVAVASLPLAHGVRTVPRRTAAARKSGTCRVAPHGAPADACRSARGSYVRLVVRFEGARNDATAPRPTSTGVPLGLQPGPERLEECRRVRPRGGVPLSRR
jgi:hypothetical protein